MSLNTREGVWVVPPDRLDKVAKLFGLLSDPTRLNILLLLAAGERNVTALQTVLRLPQATVSHHLMLLRQGGAVARRRAGKEMFYSLVAATEPGAVLALSAGGLSVRLAHECPPPATADRPA